MYTFTGRSFVEVHIPLDASSEQLLTSNHTLKHLVLLLCHLSDDDICSLARGLKHSRLKKLDLWRNYTQKGTDKLYDVLKDHPILTKEMVGMSEQKKIFFY